MARQVQPKLVGVLKQSEVGSERWITTVWRLPSGGVRMIAEKARVASKSAISGEELVQLSLKDVEGNIPF